MSNEKDSPLAQARNSALITQGELAELVGVSVPVVVNWEKRPEAITVGRLRKLYDVVPPDGKAILERFTDDIFLR